MDLARLLSDFVSPRRKSVEVIPFRMLSLCTVCIWQENHDNRNEIHEESNRLYSFGKEKKKKLRHKKELKDSQSWKSYKLQI
jgi:hypothetical protein